MSMDPQFTEEQIQQFKEYENYLADKTHEEASTAAYPAMGGAAGATAGAAIGGGKELAKIPGAIKEALSSAKAPAAEVSTLTSGDKWAKAIGGPGGANQDIAVQNRAMQKSLTPKEAAEFKVAREGIIVPNKVEQQLAKEAAVKSSKLPARIAQGVESLGPLAPIAGKALALGSAGFDVGDAIDRGHKGEYGRAIVSGLGALGSGATMIPHPAARIGGTAAATAAPFINMYLDKVAREHPELAEKLHLAEGGAVQGYAGGGIIDMLMGRKPAAPQQTVAPQQPNKEAITALEKQAIDLWNQNPNMSEYDPRIIKMYQQHKALGGNGTNISTMSTTYAHGGAVSGSHEDALKKILSKK